MTTRKLHGHRERLIFCIALEDQIIDQILFRPLIDQETNNHIDIPSKVGWSIIPSGFRQFHSQFNQQTSYCTDKTAWDWTVLEWVVTSFFHSRFSNQSEAVKTAMWGRFMEVLGPLCRLRLPDGARYQQTEWGVMKSGWILTLCMNSDAQHSQLVLACHRLNCEVPRLWATGDDTIIDHNPHPQLEQELGRTGCIVKHHKQKCEFMGMDISRKSLNPLYEDKHRFKLAHMSDEKMQETLNQLAAFYALASPGKWIEDFEHLYKFPKSVYRAWALGLLELSLVW